MVVTAYVRLVTGEIDPDSQQPKGILQAAYELRGRNGLSAQVRKELTDSLDWFQSHLPVPDRSADVPIVLKRMASNLAGLVDSRTDRCRGRHEGALVRLEDDGF